MSNKTEYAPLPEPRLFIRKNLVLASLAVFAATSAFGGTTPAEISPTAAAATKEKSVFDSIWGLATLYKNDANPWLQEFKLRGRYHGQYHWLDSNQGDTSDWENRRSRIGFDAKLFGKQIEIRLDAQGSEEFDPFYDRLVDAYVKWKPSNAFSLTLGKQKPQIGAYDWLPSTNYQPTFERSAIFNQLKVDRTLGANVEGKVDRFTYQAGVYSNDVDREFGQFDGGTSYGAGLGYDLKESLGLDKADLRLDWLHSDSEENDTVLNKYEDIISTTLWLKDGRWSFVAEAFLATGGAPDVFGFYLQPTYDVIPEKLQLVGRYSVSTGDGGESVNLQKRYEAQAPSLDSGGKGETYQSIYLGLQYFIYGDRLKFLAGAEYSHLSGGPGRDYEGLTFLSGVRFSF